MFSVTCGYGRFALASPMDYYSDRTENDPTKIWHPICTGCLRLRFLIYRLFGQILHNIFILCNNSDDCAITSQKIEIENIAARGVLRIPKTHNLAKFEVSTTIWCKVIQVFVIFQKTCLRFEFPTQTPIFSKLQTKISRERKKLF